MVKKIINYFSPWIQYMICFLEQYILRAVIYRTTLNSFDNMLTSNYSAIV